MLEWNKPSASWIAFFEKRLLGPNHEGAGCDAKKNSAAKKAPAALPQNLVCDQLIIASE